MYMEWPETTLSMPGFEEVTDPSTGQLLLRGPRLRMGVSDGAPTSVLPDHMGYANYTGRRGGCLRVTHRAVLCCAVLFAVLAIWGTPIAQVWGVVGIAYCCWDSMLS
jgi:hypothetical protein